MTERKKFKFELFFQSYFANFGKIVLLNLIFCVPSTILTLLCYFISTLLPAGFQMIVLLFSVVLVFPFYSGIVYVIRNLLRGDKDVKIFSSYIKGLKENFLSFIVHGCILFVIVLVSYLSITIYVNNLNGFLIWSMFIICIIIVLFLLFTFYYIPIMTVTFDIKKRYVYKNSFLMSFGELKNNLFATLNLAIFLAIIATIVVFCASLSIFYYILLSLIWALILPTTMTYIVNFYIYDDMMLLISNKEEKKKDIQERIDNGGKKVEKEPVIEIEDFSDIDITKLKDTDDYIFHNGKMVKQSTILKKLKEQESRENNG